MCILKKEKGFHEKLGGIKPLNNKRKLSIVASNRVNFKRREHEGARRDVGWKLEDMGQGPLKECHVRCHLISFGSRAL